MKVYIDLTSLYNRKITGLEIYGIDLYKALLKKNNLKVIPIFRKKNTIDDNIDSIIIPFENRILVEQFYLPKIVGKLNKAIVLYPVFPPGYLTYYFKSENVKIIPTIHDTVIWNYSETLSLKAKLYLKPMYNLALKKADKIVTVSETVKDELKKITNKNIINYSNCISDKYDNIPFTENDIFSKLNIEKNKYILSVSTIEPRKNLIYLLKIYKNLLNLGFDKKLVLVGRKGWGGNNKLKVLLEELEDKIVFSEFISDDELISLYSECNSFFLLSIYEGFGRPPLEALACGAKVYVSDIPIFREVLQNDAIFLPLDNIKEASSIIIKTKIKKGVKLNKYSFKNFTKNLNVNLLNG
jgi:glycosyltransferase involved in cell wall biosynthesis